ncbi:MAG TPA: MmgE/PrpD family protein [Thermodesulfobacteriota bacterium]|nr:MmgE/PrpD family protein [Thermodesulfobacteriota bacterium]
MITQVFARRAAEYPLDQVPEATVREAKKCFLNWLGNAIGAHRHPSVGMMLNVARALNSSPQATVVGTAIKADLQFAAILNGMSSTMWDFDDTHMETIMHPSAPLFPALVSWCEHARVPGRKLLQAFVLGFEAEARVGLCLGREGHYERGWHITSTAGTFGSAAALGKLLSLSPTQMQHAFGIACAQANGLREMFGTHTKPLHVGKAAANGLLSALLAREGMTSAPQPLEGKAGYAYLVSTAPDFRPLQEPWGENWQILRNTYKPFACGIVAHPSIDAAIQLRRRGVKAAEIDALTARVHPLTLVLTGKPEPRDTLEAIFSVQHGVAVGILDGKAGQREYTTERVNDAEVANLRRKVTAIASPEVAIHQAVLEAELKSGETVRINVDKVIGSLENPLTEKALEEKFLDMTAPFLSPERQGRIVDFVRDMERQPCLGELLPLCESDRDG